MRISDSLLDLIISRCTIQYNGTHAPFHSAEEAKKHPHYGRNAYWSVFVPGYGFSCKVTAPVKAFKPKQATLDKLLRKELRRRINAIQETVETNHYGEVHIVMRDPYSVRNLVESIDKAYIQGDASNLSIRFFGTGSKAKDTTIAKQA